MARKLLNTQAEPIFTALPSSPVDGQVINYQADANNGVIWRFRYNAASVSSFKWEFIGGSSLSAGPAGDITTAATSYVAMTGGPTIVLPFSGDYDIELTTSHIANQASSGYSTSDVQANTTDTGPSVTFVFQNATGQAIDLFKSIRVNSLTVGQTLNVKVYCANGGSNRFVNARLRIRPIRVG